MSDEKQARIALVTGASRGIGEAIAKRLVGDGCLVFGTATSQLGADKISAYLSEMGNSGQGLVLDVTDLSSIEGLIAHLKSDYGVPEILVNNAGITRDNLLLRMKEDEWGDIINTNLTSIYRMTKACLKAMFKAKKGRIINISSVVGSIGNPGQANYAAAKAGLVGFTKSCAMEAGLRNITVNVVSPGFIDTDMTRELSEEQRGRLSEQIPLGRLGQPEDIAAAVSFLASEQASYITGHNLHVNGGMFMD